MAAVEHAPELDRALTHFAESQGVTREHAVSDALLHYLEGLLATNAE